MESSVVFKHSCRSIVQLELDGWQGMESSVVLFVLYADLIFLLKYLKKID